MCQRRPADPTDPGDAADLSIMGYFWIEPASLPSCRPRLLSMRRRFAQDLIKINHFLTTARESLGLR
ncbi:hypothetical protein FJW06_29745 [Mesorhizobium sp. B4-1-3]|uniref:Uncharacterized protein n=1 Tax=Mesorhizobium plurifarium TaxID=69974 RepID=A0A0K2W2H5_MESPL|nr:hypothetical protein FJW06_29745 [Mesorhizobium sp. B4-1-3]CDX59558.1 conserved hypothetical protein [Mesorhizobium plurifarium]